MMHFLYNKKTQNNQTKNKVNYLANKLETQFTYGGPYNHKSTSCDVFFGMARYLQNTLYKKKDSFVLYKTIINMIATKKKKGKKKRRKKIILTKSMNKDSAIEMKDSETRLQSNYLCTNIEAL